MNKKIIAYSPIVTKASSALTLVPNNPNQTLAYIRQAFGKLPVATKAILKSELARKNLILGSILAALGLVAYNLFNNQNGVFSAVGSLAAYPNLKLLSMYTINTLAGAIAFYTGNVNKQGGGTGTVSAKYARYETIKGALNAIVWTSLGLLKGELDQLLSPSWAAAILFFGTKVTWDPFYNACDAKALIYLDLAKEKWRDLFPRKLYAHWQFGFNFLPPFEGDTRKAKLLNATFARGGLYRLSTYTIFPLWAIAMTNNLISVLFALFHSKSSQKAQPQTLPSPAPKIPERSSKSA
jgi:hypothetical protein